MTGMSYPAFNNRNNLQKLQTQILTIDGLHKASEKLIDTAQIGVTALNDELIHLQQNINRLSVQTGEIINSMTLTRLHNLLQNINNGSGINMLNILMAADQQYFQDIVGKLIDLYSVPANTSSAVNSGAKVTEINNDYQSLVDSINANATGLPHVIPGAAAAAARVMPLIINTYDNPASTINLIKMNLSYINNTLYNSYYTNNADITIDLAAPNVNFNDNDNVVQPITPLNVVFNGIAAGFLFTLV